MASDLAEQLRGGLAVPVVVAPMFLVSGPDLLVASCEAGVIGSIPTQNARTLEQLEVWLDDIRDRLEAVRRRDGSPCRWAASMIVHRSYDRFERELELMAEHRPDLVVTALGSPKRVLDVVHGYGGAVFADVLSVQHARKAADAGADGLVLVCSGAGGHTGVLSPFAFVDEVRRFFDGPLIIGGAISTGQAVRAAEVLGADLAYMGTRFIASPESLVADAYREMLVRARSDGIVATRAVTGVLASWLVESLAAAGYDEQRIASNGKIDFSDVHGDNKPWKDIFGAGQGVGAVQDIAPVADVVAEILAEYHAAALPAAA